MSNIVGVFSHMGGATPSTEYAPQNVAQIASPDDLEGLIFSTQRINTLQR
ncbi:MAG: hypothetical protein WCE73_01305 [Candidatus Angelobacter sp.]